MVHVTLMSFTSMLVGWLLWSNPGEHSRPDSKPSALTIFGRRLLQLQQVTRGANQLCGDAEGPWQGVVCDANLQCNTIASGDMICTSMNLSNAPVSPGSAVGSPPDQVQVSPSPPVTTQTSPSPPPVTTQASPSPPPVTAQVSPSPPPVTTQASPSPPLFTTQASPPPVTTQTTPSPSNPITPSFPTTTSNTTSPLPSNIIGGPGQCESRSDIGVMFGPGSNIKCRDLPQSVISTSNWCQPTYPPLQIAPSSPCRKVSRQTVYDGPVKTHLGYCNRTLNGREDAALVALSQKYMNDKYTWGSDPHCGMCLCVKILGADYGTPENLDKKARMEPLIAPYVGTCYKAFVGDRCGECDDYHVDVLMDVPYSYAPITPNNPAAREVNAATQGIPRLVADPAFAYDVGVWIIEWDWVDCSADCTKCEF